MEKDKTLLVSYMTKLGKISSDVKEIIGSSGASDFINSAIFLINDYVNNIELVEDDKKTDKMSKTDKVEIGFAEWLGRNYIRLNAYWVHRYCDQTDKENWRTTEELYDFWLYN